MLARLLILFPTAIILRPCSPKRILDRLFFFIRSNKLQWRLIIYSDIETILFKKELLMVFSFVRRAFDWITQKFPTKTISRKMANVYNLEWGNYAAKGTTENDEIIPRVLFLIDSICIQVWDWVGASARWWAMAVAHVSHRYDLINTVIINSSPCSYFSSLFFFLFFLFCFSLAEWKLSFTPSIDHWRRRTSLWFLKKKTMEQEGLPVGDLIGWCGPPPS